MNIRRGLPQPWWKKAKGFVYVIYSSTGLFKIGHANNVKRRFGQHRHDYPGEELELVGVIKAKNRYTTEHELHQKFAAKRVRGEWFDLTNPDLAYLAHLEETSKTE